MSTNKPGDEAEPLPPDDPPAQPELDSHDGNTIIEGPLPEGAFDAFEAEPPATGEPEPGPPPEKKPGAASTRKRVKLERGTKVRRTGTGVHTAKMTKPPGKKGLLLKKLLFFSVPLLIAGLIVAGFFVRDEKGNSIWVAVGRRWGILKGDKGLKPKLDPHPSQLAFNEIRDHLEALDQQLNDVGRQVDGGTWDKTSALKALETLEAVRERLEKVDRKLTDFETWFSGTYLPNQAEYETAQQAKDQARMRELDVVIERGKYLDLTVKETDVNGARALLTRIRGRANRLRSEFPAREEIEAGKLPGQPRETGKKKEDTKKDDTKKEGPKIEADVARLHPYFGAAAGSWRRWEAKRENLVMLSEETRLQDEVVQSIDKDGVVVKGFVWDAGRETASPEEARTTADLVPKVVGAEKLSVKGIEVECLVVEYSGPRRVWLARSGRFPDRIPLKIDGAMELLLAVGMEEKTVKVKGSEIPCVYVQLEGKADGKEKVRRIWYAEVPGSIARQETDIGNETRETLTLVEFGEAPRPPFSSTKREDPKLELPKAPNAWVSFAPGTWVRRTTAVVEGERVVESWEDLTLLKIDADQVTVRVEHLWETGQTSEETAVHVPWDLVAVRRENLDVAGTTYPCIVGEKGTRRAWLCSEGTLAGLALREDQGGISTRVVRVGQEKVSIGEKEFPCLLLEFESSNGEKARTWRSSEIPDGLARSEIERSTGGRKTLVTVAVMEFGQGTKPPFPRKEKPREKTAQQYSSDADSALVEGGARLKEVGKSYREGLPSDKEKLRGLKQTADSAENFFKGAIEGYIRAKALGAAGGEMDEKIAKCRKALTLLRKYQDAIEAELAK